MSKSHIIFLSLSIFIACSSPENSNNQKAEQLVETDELPEVTPNETDSTFSKPVIEPTQQQNIFAGKTYFLTSDYDLDNCENLSRCDCCTSEIAFLDESRYAYMFICEGTTVFNKGTYKIDSLRITLNHAPFYVSDEQPIYGEEMDSTQFGVFVYNEQVEPYHFAISTCNDRTLIHSIRSNNRDYGTEGANSSSGLRSILSDQTSEITKKLKVK